MATGTEVDDAQAIMPEGHSAFVDEAAAIVRTAMPHDQHQFREVRRIPCLTPRPDPTSNSGTLSLSHLKLKVGCVRFPLIPEINNCAEIATGLARAVAEKRKASRDRTCSSARAVHIVERGVTLSLNYHAQTASP